MRISAAARASGVSKKLIRYYESAGLLRPAGRTANGYRVFDERNVHELRFIKRARSLGFPVKQINQLLSLWRDQKRPSRRVRDLAVNHKQAIVARMQAHQAILTVLTRLIASCKGDNRPECPILDDLSQRKSEQSRRRQSVRSALK